MLEVLVIFSRPFTGTVMYEIKAKSIYISIPQISHIKRAPRANPKLNL